MHKNKTKAVRKERKQKILGSNKEATKLNKTNTTQNDRNSRKYEPSVFNSGDANVLLRKPQYQNKLNENYISNPDLITLEKTMVDLVNQRDDLLRYYRILTGSDENKNLNIESLMSEISGLKSIIGTLQKGLSVISDEHSVIKGLVISKLNVMDNLLEQSLNGRVWKSNCSENDEEYLSSRFNKNYSLPLPRYFNSGHSLFELCKTSSNLNNPNNHLFSTVSKISGFNDSKKNDCMVKFRQLAELKIITEILQKYSKIVTDEFRNLNYTEEADQNPFDVKLNAINNTCQKDLREKCLRGMVCENNKDPCHVHPSLADLEYEVKHIKNSLDFLPVSLPQYNLNMTTNKYKTSRGENIEDHLETPSNSLNCEEPDKNVNSIISKDCLFCHQSSFDKGNIFKIINNKQKSSTSFDAFEQVSKKSKKKKVLFLSDIHGRYCSQFLQDELGPNYSVISVLKPDANFQEIIEGFHDLSSSFSREDFVVIFAGSNNLKCKNTSKSHIDLELLIPMFKHTNVILTRIPLLFDQPLLNSQIRRVNSENSRKICELAKKHSNILLMPKYTFFSRNHPKPNFNRIGKKSFCKILAKSIMTDSCDKNQKPCVGSQSIATFEHSVVPIPLDATVSELLNYVEDMKLLTPIPTSENTKNYISKENSFDNLHQNHKSNQQLWKNTQTQTSKENLYECSCQIANDKLGVDDPKLHSKNRTSLENCVESAKLDFQPTRTERKLIFDEYGGDYCKDPGDHHQRQGYFAGIFMKNNQASMTTIKELLGQGDIPKPRKNFIQENVKRLKELKLEKTNKLGSQRNKTLQPLVERRNAQTMVSSSRFTQRSVSGRPVSQLSPSPPLRSRRTNKHVTLDTQRASIVEVDESPKGYRSQGCQTLSSKQLEHLYDEGVIRYPSVRDVRSRFEGSREGRIVKEMALQTETPVEVLHPTASPPHTVPPPMDEGLHWDEEKKAEDKDYVKINATVPDPRRQKTPDPFSTDPNRAPPTYQRGVVPRYLREQKKEMEREKMNKAKEEDCPEGHIQLPDDIRQKHLTTLRQKYEELVSQLNQLPVSTDTLRTRTRKKQIETDLDRVEAAIALFSREKVFVKADS